MDYIPIPKEFTPVPNAMAERLARVTLKTKEHQVIWFILRKTLGYAKSEKEKLVRKKTDRLALSQISLGLGVDRRRVHDALKSLIKRRIITVRDGKDRQPKTYGMNYDLASWQLSPPSRTDSKKKLPGHFVHPVGDRLSTPERTALSPPLRTALSSPSAPTKERKENLKETLKESAHPGPFQGGPGGAAKNGNRQRHQALALLTPFIVSRILTDDDVIGLKHKSADEILAMVRALEEKARTAKGMDS